MAVIIVGGGIGGMTLALALARRGVSSTVIEQAEAIDAVGAGIQLSPNATRVLEGLGLLDTVQEGAVQPEQAEVRDAASGRLLVASRLGGWARARWGSPYLVLSRSALQTALLQAVRARGEIELVLGRRVSGVHDLLTRPGVRSDDGSFLHGEAVIGCDGLHSVVRHALVGPQPPRFTGQAAWRGLARVASDAPAQVQVWTGPRQHFVHYPVGGGLVNMVAVTEAPAEGVESWTAEGLGAELAAAFADWPEPVRTTLAAVERPWRSALYDRPPLKRWSVGRAALLGDAAHAMLPFLAQGAGMAIEDAWVLAQMLSGGGDVSAALKAYQQARWWRTSKVQTWASRNAALFHLPSPLAAGLFGAAKILDLARGAEPEARFDWLYGWRA